MTLAFIFWLIMLLALIGGLVWGWPRDPSGRYPWYPFGSTLLVWALFALLGWQVFGQPLKG